MKDKERLWWRVDEEPIPPALGDCLLIPPALGIHYLRSARDGFAGFICSLPTKALDTLEDFRDRFEK